MMACNATSELHLRLKRNEMASLAFLTARAIAKPDCRRKSSDEQRNQTCRVPVIEMFVFPTHAAEIEHLIGVVLSGGQGFEQDLWAPPTPTTAVAPPVYAIGDMCVKDADVAPLSALLVAMPQPRNIRCHAKAYIEAECLLGGTLFLCVKHPFEKDSFGK